MELTKIYFNIVSLTATMRNDSKSYLTVF